MFLKIISLSAVIFSLVACNNETSETTQQTTPSQPMASTTDKKEVSPGVMDAQRNALEKAKEVQGVVDNTTDEIDKAVEKNTQ